MSKRLLFLVLLAWGTLGADAAGETLREFSVMTYNIYCGGQDHDPVFGRDYEWLQVIKSRSPDIILIQEATGWLPEEEDYLSATVESLCAAFPNDTAYVGFIDGVASDHALITRLPVLSFDAYRDVPVDGDTVHLHHGFVHARIDLWGETVHVFGVHFRAGPNRPIRRQESNALLAVIDTLPQGEKVWVCGDFNSYSPVDIEPGSPTEPDYDGGAPSAEVTGWEPVGSLLERNYEDAFRSAHPLDPAYTQDTESFYPTGRGPVHRIDFILRTPGHQWFFETVETLNDSLGHIGSDHYAVFARYEKKMPTSVESGSGGHGSYGLRMAPVPAAGPGTITFQLPSSGPVRLDLYTVAGRRVRSLLRGERSGGRHDLLWDGTDDRGRALPPGAYFLRLEGPDGAEAVKIIRTASPLR